MSCRIADELRRELVLHLPISEGVGISVKDTSKYANNGTILGGAPWVDGRILKALGLNGIDQSITIPSSPSLPKNNDIEHTLAAWIYPTAYGGTWTFSRAIIGRSMAGVELEEYNWMAFCLADDGRLMLGYEYGPGSNTSQYSDTGVVLLDAWQLVAVERFIEAATTIRFYVNGVMVTERTGCVNPTGGTTPMPLTIGYATHFSTRLEGKIGEVRAYTRILDPIDNRNLYNLRGII